MLAGVRVSFHAPWAPLERLVFGVIDHVLHDRLIHDLVAVDAIAYPTVENPVPVPTTAPAAVGIALELTFTMIVPY
jgi:hypothetical protein